MATTTLDLAIYEVIGRVTESIRKKEHRMHITHGVIFPEHHAIEIGTICPARVDILPLTPRRDYNSQYYLE